MVKLLWIPPVSTAPAGGQIQNLWGKRQAQCLRTLNSFPRKACNAHATLNSTCSGTPAALPWSCRCPLRTRRCRSSRAQHQWRCCTGRTASAAGWVPSWSSAAQGTPRPPSQRAPRHQCRWCICGTGCQSCSGISAASLTPRGGGLQAPWARSATQQTQSHKIYFLTTTLHPPPPPPHPSVLYFVLYSFSL